MEKTIFILCGLPGSGKSTWAREYVNKHKDTIIVCKDDIREMLFGAYTYRESVEPLVKNLEIVNTVQSIVHGCSVIVDATHITPGHRVQLCELIHQDLTIIENNPGYKEVFPHYERPKVKVVYFPENGNNLKYRLQHATRGQSPEIWKKAINGMKEKFVPPVKGEHHTISEVIVVEPDWLKERGQ